MKKKVVLFYPDPLPKGSLYVENMTPASALCAVRLLDRDKYDIKIIARYIDGDDFVDQILAHCEDAILFGVSAMIGYQITQGLEVSKQVKRRHKELPIVWGGWFPSSDPEMTMENEFIDMVVMQQGEQTVVEIVEALEKRTPLDTIKGLCFKDKDEKIIKNEPRPFIDLNELPPIPYDLVDTDLVYNMDGYKTIDYMTSYGCPHRCTFCCEPAVNKRKWLGLSPERMVADLKEMQSKFGIEAVTLLDTNTFVDKNRMRKFCELYIKEGLNTKFTMTCGKISHLIKFDDELWELLVKAGITRIQIGAEAGSQEYLNLLKKDNKVEDTLKVVYKAAEHNVKLFISTMIGLPSADMKVELDDILTLINDVLEINDENKFSMYLYTPLPATSLMQVAEEQGFEPPKTLEEWGSYDFNKKFVPWIDAYYVKLLEKMQFYFKYVLVTDLIYSTPSPVIRKLYQLIYSIFNPIARYRFRKKFFGFPVDYYFLKISVSLGMRLQALIDQIVSQKKEFPETIDG